MSNMKYNLAYRKPVTKANDYQWLSSYLDMSPKAYVEEGLRLRKELSPQVGVGGVAQDSSTTTHTSPPPTKSKSFADLCHLHQTDKCKYAAAYAEILHGKKIKKLLEFGIQGGASLCLWKEMFPNAEIAGVDSTISRYATIPQGVYVVEGHQEDPVVLANLVRNGPYDVIIDDAGHNFNHQIPTFDTLRSHARIYIIEDLTECAAKQWREKSNPDQEFKSTVTDEWLFVWRAK